LNADPQLRAASWIGSTSRSAIVPDPVNNPLLPAPNAEGLFRFASETGLRTSETVVLN
jgi:hypothetical protein